MYKKISGIYCIENIINNKKYIGQSVNIKDRWNKHIRDLKNNNHDNDYLQKSWNKYGEKNFIFYIIEECIKEDLDDKEKYYINLYNTLDYHFGYNLKTGGQDNGVTVSDYVKKKISNAVKNSYNDSLIKKRKEDALKQWSNPLIKEKISGKNNHMYGKTHTEEARKKISDANKGRISHFRNTTPVRCIELDRIFSCAVEAKKILNLNVPILEVCYGNRKTAGGYHWEFVMENNT